MTMLGAQSSYNFLFQTLHWVVLVQIVDYNCFVIFVDCPLLSCFTYLGYTFMRVSLHKLQETTQCMQCNHNLVFLDRSS